MFSYWTYILVGRNATGKTTFQRHLVYHLCGRRLQRLRRNVVNNITHPRAPRTLLTLFTSNRSYQEKETQYKTVPNYFHRFFTEADVCILSSHTQDPARRRIAEMIRELRRRCYNVAGVFLSNAWDDEAREIATLRWDEVLWIDNPLRESSRVIDEQLDGIARQFSDLILARAQLQ